MRYQRQAFIKGKMNKVLLDTNILLYAFDAKHEFHLACRQVLLDAKAGKIKAFITTTTALEFYRVVRSIAYKKTISEDDALFLYNFITNTSFIRTLSISASTLEILYNLMEKTESEKIHIFDLILVAAMRENKIRTIYTKNVKHFQDLKSISIIDPT